MRAFLKSIDERAWFSIQIRWKPSLVIENNETKIKPLYKWSHKEIASS